MISALFNRTRNSRESQIADRQLIAGGVLMVTGLIAYTLLGRTRIGFGFDSALIIITGALLGMKGFRTHRGGAASRFVLPHPGALALGSVGVAIFGAIGAIVDRVSGNPIADGGQVMIFGCIAFTIFAIVDGRQVQDIEGRQARV
jgi:hypothetical protein